MFYIIQNESVIFGIFVSATLEEETLKELQNHIGKLFLWTPQK